MTEFERLFQSKDAVIVQLCPRWLHEKARKCLKPLINYKCPQHGLIREVMPQ
jgi:hypothetical protein